MNTTAGKFIALLGQERRSGTVSIETEQHFKHDFRKLSWQADNAMLAASVRTQIGRLEREAEALRRLGEACFGAA